MTHGSLFSGIGGFDLGFERAGIGTSWQVENSPSATRVLEAHWPEVKRYGDIRGCGRHNLAPVDLVSGGFPCQDLSTSQNGRRWGLAGERSGLFFEAARVIEELRPRWFVLENVRGLFSSHEGEDFDVVVSALAELGYCVAWRTLDSQYFGVPQHRERVYVVGGLGHEGPVLVLFEGLPKAEPGNAREAPPQAVVPVAINPYQHGSNGVGISYVVHTLDSRPDRVVLAPLDGGGVGGPPGVPRRMDVARTRLVGNAVTVSVAEWLGRRIAALDRCILGGEEIHVGIL
jgi:site-specific DNA-cytosine methylase